jgi:hypothetical protein
MKISTTTTKIKKQSKKISGMISELKKQFFALEVMQSKWEADHGLMKPIGSVDEYMARITKSA